jgi:enoyl-CoA hydratase
MSDEVLTEKLGSVLVITINRPERHNAVTAAVISGLSAAMATLEEDKSLEMGILTGAGQSFCSGMDLAFFAEMGDGDFASDGIEGLTDRADDAKLLIAAIEGYALAGGCEIALCCDLIVAANDAQFGLPEVKHGLVATAGGLFRLPRRIPRAVALELVLTADRLTAERGERLGLVNRLVEPGTALDAAKQLAADIQRNSAAAVQASKTIMQQSITLTDAQAFEAQHPVSFPIQSSAQAKAGALAFTNRKSQQATT